MQGTIGQSDAGVLAGGGFTVTGGFPGFHVVPAGPVTLAIQVLPNGQFQVTWPASDPQWVLEGANALAPNPDWQTLTAPGATRHAAAAGGPARYFRLRHP